MHEEEEGRMSEGKTFGMTRRDFTKMSAAAGVAALALSRFEIAEAAKKKPLKVGLLGCGGRGTGAATQMLIGNENVKLVAMADLFEDRLTASLNKIKSSGDEIAKKVDVNKKNIFIGLDAYKGILETDIDILMEGTLPYSRPKHVEAAVEAGKHIFTEKPAAVDPAGIRRFIAAAKKAEEKKLCLVAGTQRRHQKAYVDTIKKIHDGAIGDIVALRAYWCGSLPFTHERKPEWSDLEYCVRNWYAFCWICGDNIVEQHVHNLDIMNWVMKGHPVKVFASGGRAWKTNDPKYGDLWDQFSCDYEYANGVRMTSMSRHWDGADGGVFEDAVGSKGRSNCCDMMDTGGEKPIDPYVQEHIDLVNSIRGVTPYINEGVQVAESTMTAIMGRMSAYTGKELKWDDAINSDLSLVPEDLSFDKPYPLGPIPVPGKPA
ncbi:MAG: Gfo/Idh/MocA family oxidoreductase [Candidatus Hydrogenedentes bacterium]|nr:Gfo/Idh/MocA family oxidoreductase [Candidatus Hydrogenedentota bacterium]